MKATIADVGVTACFPTPVIAAQLAEAAKLNEQLARTIMQREGATKGTAHSNLGGWQSSWDFQDWGGPAIKAVLDAAKQLANRYTADRQGRPVQVDWKVNCWANVNRSGHANVVHTHPGCYWSGTYYVDDGGVGADPRLGGEFEMQDPRGVGPAMYAPSLAYALPGMLSIGASETIPPKAGMLILFPPWLPHGVLPYHGNRTRISVAFNLSVY